MKALVIWDVDGTLTDSKPGIFASYRYAARQSGLPEPSDDILETMCCGELYGHIFQLFGKTGKEADRLAIDYRWHYSEICSQKVKLFEGVTGVLEYLSSEDVDQAVATMNNQDGAVTLLERLGIAKHFKKIAGADLEGNITKAMMIRDCMSVDDYDKVIMIGDCPGDYKAASEVGAEFLAVTYGYGYPKETCVEKKLFFASTPIEILEKLDSEYGIFGV